MTIEEVDMLLQKLWTKRCKHRRLQQNRLEKSGAFIWQQKRKISLLEKHIKDQDVVIEGLVSARR